MLDYAPTAPRGVPVVFVIPSLINRSYILDLDTDHSWLRALAAKGLRPMLLDWGRAGASERALDMSGYLITRIAPALETALRIGGQPVATVGYCMGGLLALAAAARWPASIRAVALLATPWDFHAGRNPKEAQAHVSAIETWLAPWLKEGAALPVDVLQALFALMQPVGMVEKFRRFAGMNPHSEAARRFVLVEDWLNDGVPLPGLVARDGLHDWYRDNLPAQGLWQIAGQTCRAQDIRQPALVIVPGQDRIVPPDSARALARDLPHATLNETALGHIGMIASRRAPRLVWDPLAQWLLSESRAPGRKGDKKLFTDFNG